MRVLVYVGRLKRGFVEVPTLPQSNSQQRCIDRSANEGGSRSRPAGIETFSGGKSLDIGRWGRRFTNRRRTENMMPPRTPTQRPSMLEELGASRGYV